MIDDNRGLGRTQRVLDRMIAYLRARPERRCNFLVHAHEFGRHTLERVPGELQPRITVISTTESARGQTTFVDHSFIEKNERKLRQKIEDSAARIDAALRIIANERLKQRGAETRIACLHRIEEMSVR